MMSHVRCMVWVVVLCLPMLAACGPLAESGGEDTSPSPSDISNDVPNQTRSETEEDAASASGDDEADEGPDEPSMDASPIEGSTYRHPEGAFEISFPEHYAQQPQANGLSFLSANGQFGGEVTYFEVEDDLTTDALEELYRQRAHDIFREIAWQGSELQPDGSVRLDWRGQNAAGQDLDAIGYIEQHGDRVYILNMYGINESYDVYLEDSRVIVGSYQVDRNP